MMESKTIKESKKQGEESYDFISKIKEDVDYTISWLSALTDFEQAITSLLYNENKALSIKQIRTTLLFNTFTKYKLAKLQHIKDTQIFVDKFNSVTFPFVNYLILQDDISVKILDKMKKETIFEEFLKMLSQEKVKVPSFGRINEVINNLYHNRVILKRESLSKKIKALYFLNPIIRVQLNKKKENLSK